MKALLIGILSAISFSAAAYDYATGYVNVMPNRYGQPFYACNVANNSPAPALTLEVNYYFQCRGRAPVSVSIPCTRNCIIPPYRTWVFDGPAACPRGARLQPTCEIRYTY